ncbi:GNAT family N-acetyltransferase [Chitinophaga sp. Cy-1792]|uniref:GNAT family N-acetyltransferase n=1 Tax=Chitinophaga sp. Cy-1792 TaxID=2608339 RepID=UPI00142256DE|nr:GNAT family N-acetyltransferase [Chitinophaga sp. Cy-1792]NIG55577.1 GNAT family N-acetyltransferase [Chitinophaga sp. Cy-1792]
MTRESYLPLDNPVWHSLQTVQRYFALGTEQIQRYKTDVLPFMGFDPETFTTLEEIRPWLAPGGESLFIVGELPALPERWSLLNELVCLQMVCEEKPEKDKNEGREIIALTATDKAAMLEFVNQVQPGYFLPETPELGNYFGIREKGKLIAMAGQRMQMAGLTEVSAVVTHPDHTGKGHATALVRHLCRVIFDAGDIPFLHVTKTNARAVAIYEQLKFKVRREISFWKVAVK